MRWLKQAVRGAGYLEGYGHHPGWAILIAITLAGGVAGIDKGGLVGFFGGMLFAAVFTLPLFIVGCIGRANDCDKSQAKLLNTIKNS